MALRATWAGSRQLLRRIRDVMAGTATAQARLDDIVRIIARDMVAEVCSMYVRRAGDVIELFSTEGLREDAVHKIRFRFGEGIVGAVAATATPVAVADAQSHPSFAYRPETGEEAYKSMLGVPVLRGGRVLGVLAVQNKTSRDYTEEEVETLETVGMVVAELIASGELIQRSEQQPADGLALRPLRLEGVRLSAGLAMGTAVLHQPILPVGDPVAEDEEVELERLEVAINAMHSALDTLIERYGSDSMGDHLDVLRTHRMFAEDRGWNKRIREAIGTGLTAEAAVIRVQNDMRARMAAIQDPYLRERMQDFEDLTQRLLQHLAGKSDAPQFSSVALPENAILVARNMGPAELLDFDASRLRAVILEEGSATSHIAIVAKALDIPLVGQIRDVMARIEPNDPLVVDGNNGVCFVRPGEEFQNTFARSMAIDAQERATFAQERDLPTVTKDGHSISLQINAGLLIDVPHLHSTGAVGIGLYRTEVPFMVRAGLPDVESQTRLYSSILEQAEGKSVVFRTLDIGGDKIPTYVRKLHEENPAMGWRAIRIGLDRPAMLRQQLRALVSAAAGKPLSVMFPMITEVAELKAARELLDRELERQRSRGEALPSELRVGVMIEVPALVFQLDALLPMVDFVSVGSNDLQQFTFASDRGNPKLDGRYDPLAPGMLNLLRVIAEKANNAGVSLSLCGEMAGNTVDAMALVGLGFRTLSMNARSIGPVRRMVRSMNVSSAEDMLRSHFGSREHSLRGVLTSFARDHDVQV